MITITRRLAQQLRTVLRRAFGNFRGNGPAVAFIAGKEGLTAKSMFGDVAVECRLPGERTTEIIWLPFEFLADVAGKNDELVEIEAISDGQASIQWRSGNMPQIVNYDSKEPCEANKFPILPTAFTSNPPGLLQALHEASEVTSPEGVRYATDCIQLSPDGTINATDGHQLLIQSGFTFPWQEPVLVPRSKVFTSLELPQDQPVGVARSGDWVALQGGRWTVYLRIDIRRYPRVSDIVPNPANAKARCQLSVDDVHFLAETLPQLPFDEEDGNNPLTIDLNGQIAIRAKGADKEGEKAKPTEVILTNSQWTGEPIRINTNRTYLQRAMRLGLNDLSLYGDDRALLCQACDRKFVWMPLSSESAIPPTDDVIRIESPQGELAASIPQSVTPMKVPAMNESTTNKTGKAAPNGQAKADTTAPKASRRKASQQDIAALIDQAVRFRTALHDLMHESTGLVKALKHHRRQGKAVQQTIDQIRTLKTFGV